MTLGVLRKSASLTQEDLSKLLNVNRSTIAMWETGVSYPRAENLLQLSQILGVPAGDILTAINEMREGNDYAKREGSIQG